MNQEHERLQVCWSEGLCPQMPALERANWSRSGYAVFPGSPFKHMISFNRLFYIKNLLPLWVWKLFLKAGFWVHIGSFHEAVLLCLMVTEAARKNKCRWSHFVLFSGFAENLLPLFTSCFFKLPQIFLTLCVDLWKYCPDIFSVGLTEVSLSLVAVCLAS